MEATLTRIKPDHCSICKLCPETEQLLGGEECKAKQYQQFKNAQWHDGIEWHPLRLGRAVDKNSIVLSKSRKRYIAKNKETKVLISSTFTEEHLNVMNMWSRGIQSFWNIQEFTDYMISHPFAYLLEFRVEETLVGFDWIIELNELVIHQLLPWLKEEYSTLGIGLFAKKASISIWENSIHLYGEDGTFKQQFGGWTYEKAV